MIRTTNIVIEDANNLSFDKVKAKYNLIRYTIPNSFQKQRKDYYARFHNNYKEQLDKPYYFWTYKDLLYVLYPVKELPKPIVFNYFNDEQVQPEHLAYDEIPLHVFMKLMLAEYFYNGIEKQQRICQPNFLVLGKSKGNKFTAVEIELLDDYTNASGSGRKEFYLKPSAKILLRQNKLKLNPDYIMSSIYYQDFQKDGTTYFRQVKPKMVKDWLKSNNAQDLYVAPNKFLKEKAGVSRAHLDWFSAKNYKATRGYIVYQFQQNFCNYLQEHYQIPAQPKQIEVQPVEALNFSNRKGISATGLPIKDLVTIYVLDNRLINRETGKPFNNKPLSEFIDLLKQKYARNLHVHFTEISRKSLTADKAVLVVQDYNKDDFKLNEKNEPVGFLAKNGYTDDPKLELYSANKSVPLQTVSVNNNIYPKKTDDWTTFFNYHFDINSLEQKLEVSFNELYLKRAILKEGDLHQDFMYYFLDKANKYLYLYNDTLLYFNGKINFIDVAKDKALLHQQLPELDMSYGEIKRHFQHKYKYRDGIVSEKFAKTHFILAEGMVAEIQDTEERLLYDYQKNSNQEKVSRSKDIIKGGTGVSFSKHNNTYLVGRTDSVPMKQPFANVLKRLDFYEGDPEQHREKIFKLLTAKFVRNKQFTVYPFPFDLIKLYNEQKQY